MRCFAEVFSNLQQFRRVYGEYAVRDWLFSLYLLLCVLCGIVTSWNRPKTGSYLGVHDGFFYVETIGMF